VRRPWVGQRCASCLAVLAAWAGRMVGGAVVPSLVMAGPTAGVGLFGGFWQGGSFSLRFGWDFG
jgi:hypothetical protein